MTIKHTKGAQYIKNFELLKQRLLLLQPKHYYSLLSQEEQKLCVIKIEINCRKKIILETVEKQSLIKVFLQLIQFNLLLIRFDKI